MNPTARFVITGSFVLLLCACGDDDSGGSKAALASCNRQCESQENVVGCEPFVDLATCKQLCEQLVSGIRGGCDGEFSAYYDCSADDGFSCAGSLVTQATDACDDAKSAYDSCQKGGSNRLTCAGARDSGTCPQVACPCPGGDVPVSGFDNGANGCECWDEVTCKDLTCE